MNGFFVSDGRHGSRSLPRGCFLDKWLIFMQRFSVLEQHYCCIAQISIDAKRCNMGLKNYGVIKTASVL